MKKYKKLVTLTLLTAVLSATSIDLNAQVSASVGGVGYEESLLIPSLTPYIALGAVAAIAIVAVAVQHTHGHGHSHGHSHSH